MAMNFTTQRDLYLKSLLKCEHHYQISGILKIDTLFDGSFGCPLSGGGTSKFLACSTLSLANSKSLRSARERHSRSGY